MKKTLKIALSMIVVTISGLISYEVVGAQQNACYPVLICPAPGGTGGSGGVAGSSGQGGVSGGGAGGAGAGGAGGVPAGGIVISASLSLDKTVVNVGQTVSGSVTYGNTSSVPIVLQMVTIAGRPPGATHSGGPFADLAPSLTAVTVPASGSVTLNASHMISATDTLGKWEAYSTYQDANGWHDSPTSVSFQVQAVCAAETDAQFCSRLAKACGTVSGTDNCGSARTVQSCGLCVTGQACSSNQCVATPAGSGGGGAGGVGGSGGTGGSVSGKFSVGTQEWFIAGWAGTPVFKSGLNWATAYSSGADVWNPQFFADLQGYSTFRHMDTNAVNWSKITSWSQRKLPTDPANAAIYIDGASPSNTTGMAVEWQIDLCNRANVDCWFTHPYLADDDYIRQQAMLIKSKIKPGLKVYIELSNEVWNGTFSAFNQSLTAGQAGGLPGANQWYQGIAHEMYRAIQMYQIYQDVFGASAMGTQVVRVFSESGNLDLTTQALASVYKSTKWNPNGQKIDLMALAPYIGNGTDGADPNVLTKWKAEVDARTAGEPIATAKSQTKNNGIPLIGCYEGGMHHLQNANVFAASPQAYDAYTYMLDKWAANMNGPCNLYTLHGAWSTGGAWGLYNAIGQPLTAAPKARAVKDWINSHK